MCSSDLQRGKPAKASRPRPGDLASFGGYCWGYGPQIPSGDPRNAPRHQDNKATKRSDLSKQTPAGGQPVPCPASQPPSRSRRGTRAIRLLQLSCQMPGRGCQGLEQEHDAVPTVPPNCPGSSSRKADPARKARRHRQSHRHRGPAVPKLSGRIRATGSPPGHPPAGEHPAGPAGNRTPATL